ncbi:hypothetical protein MKW94_023513, partial [Papaver nudicaule]|nr:hypothetical protein [Papaver nudicaule]
MTKTKAKKKYCSIFRSNLEQAIDIAENIRVRIKDFPEHLEALKKCPFWNFYRPFHEGRIIRDDTKRTQKGAEHIFNSFNGRKQVFEIQGKEFKSTADQLAVIFGLKRIQFGEEEEYSVTHPEPQIQAAQTTFWETYLKGVTMIEKKDIIDSLYAAAEDVTKPKDFVRLLGVYHCAAIFFPNQSGDKLSKMFLKYVFAMDQVSWPDVIHSYLLEALREAKKPIIRLRGCTVYILFWFAEITHFISKYDGERGNSKPRFVRWNSKVLAEKIVSQGMTSLRQDLTGSFIDPLDEGEQSLITPTELRQANSDATSEMVRGIERDEDCGSSPDRNAEDL